MKAKSKTKDGIKYGNVELTQEESEGLLDPMVRTTIFLNASLVRAYKAEAAKRNVKFQQLLREKLREGMNEDSSLEGRVRRLEQALQRQKKAG